MAQYKVLERSFINNMAYDEGAIIEFDGEPGDNLEPVDEPAKKAVKTVKESGTLTAVGNDPVVKV
jgi:hypothetical protein